MMKDNLNISLEMERNALDQSILDGLETLPKIKLTLSSDITRERLEAVPDIIIVNDLSEEIDTTNRVKSLKAKFNVTSIFVISTDKRPQHIVNLMKAGVSEYFNYPFDIAELINAIEGVRTRKVSSGRKAGGKIYSFVGAKGGLGTTVLATNIAVSLATKSRKSTMFCDMCLASGDASILLDIQQGPTIVDISRNFHRLDVSLLRGALTSHKTGIDFLAAPPNPEDGIEVHGEHVEQILGLVRQLYDHVIVDCPSMSKGDNTQKILKASEMVFIVTDLSVTAVRNASRYAELIQKLGVSPSQIRFLVNRFIKGGALAIEEVEATLGQATFWLFPNDFSHVVSSINRGVPLVKYQPGAALSKNISDFIEKLQNPQNYGKYRGVKGTFGRAI